MYSQNVVFSLRCVCVCVNGCVCVCVCERVCVCVCESALRVHWLDCITTVHAPYPAARTPSPPVGQDGHPPALDEAQGAVGQLHLQRDFGHPHRQLQGGAQVLVAEDDAGVHGAPRLLPVDEDVVAVHRNLEEEEEPEVRGRPLWEAVGRTGITLLKVVSVILETSTLRSSDLSS